MKKFFKEIANFYSKHFRKWTVEDILRREG